MTLRQTSSKVLLAVVLAVSLTGGVLCLTNSAAAAHRVHVTAYFANSNGIFPGDEVRILGVPVGKIDAIEPQRDRAKITFWYDGEYQVPVDAKAVILSPSLVAVRAIQLTPAYTGGPAMPMGAVIPEERTAVPVEWDDFRRQIQKLTETLQPTQPGGVSTLGSFINTAADNLRGQGDNIRDTLIKLSQAFSALGDHSDDLFSTIKHLSILVTALQSSTDLMRQLNQNLASVTGLLSNDPNEVGNAVHDVNAVVGDVEKFVSNNRETVGVTSDKLASVTTALNQSLDDLKQFLHLTPNQLQNFVNTYRPAQGAQAGIEAFNNFADPISFICGAIQAASRLNAEKSSKLCVQYLAPIIKNRQYNFPPIGTQLGLLAPFPVVGAMARPNEVTYSEDWMRPDYIPPPPPQSAPPSGNAPPLAAESPEPAEPTPSDSTSPPAAARPTDPADGLPGMMVPTGGGS